MKILNKKKFKYGGLSVLFTVIFVAAIILLNVVATMLLNRFNTKLDLTDEGLYTIGESSVKVLSSLGSDISIHVLSTEEEFIQVGDLYASSLGVTLDFNHINELLKKYDFESDRVSLDYIDLDKNPDFIKNYDETLAKYQVIVQSASTGRVKVLDAVDYFSFEYSTYGTISSVATKAEQAITSAIMSVSDKNPITVAFSTGSSEEDSTAVQKLLSDNGYLITTVNILTQEIPCEADFLVVFGPKTDLDDTTIGNIDKWLDNNGEFGKNLFYFSSFSQGDTKGIDSFLKEWGLEIPQSIVYQGNSQYTYFNMPYIHLQQLADTDYALSLPNDSLNAIAMSVRPVKTTFEIGEESKVPEFKNMQSNVIMGSYDGAYLVSYEDMQNPDYNPETAAEKGVFNSIVETVKTRYENVDEFKSRVVAFGGTGILSSNFIQSTGYSNADLFVTMFNTMSGKEDGVVIAAKSLSTPLFDMNEGQVRWLFAAFVIVVPLVVIGVGVFVWLRRRHR